MELARLRLRGAYALIAGALLLFVAPLYHALALGSAYDATTAAIAASHTFTLYLAWLMRHESADQVSRVLQTLPLLLALMLPGPLSAWLWANQRGPRLTALFAGWIGFGAFVVAGVLGIVVSASAADYYRVATSGADRAEIAANFAGRYALESFIARGIGGVALAVFLALVSLRVITSARLPRWVAYLGWLVAALEAANGVMFLFNPLNLQSPTVSLTPVGLAVWLLVVGFALWQAHRGAARQAPRPEAEIQQDAGAASPSDERAL